MSSLVQTYNQIAKGYSKTNFNKFWNKEFQIFRKLTSGKKIIDIGCGAGRDAAIFIKNKFDYTGVDVSRGMLAEARKRAPRAKFKIMSMYDLKFPKESFDGFWAAASLLHVPKARLPKVLRGIRRIIKPGGAGFISVREKKYLDEGLVQQDVYGDRIERFFSFWKIPELKKMLEDNSFKVIKAYKSNRGPGMWGSAWLCFFVKKI